MKGLFNTAVLNPDAFWRFPAFEYRLEDPAIQIPAVQNPAVLNHVPAFYSLTFATMYQQFSVIFRPSTEQKILWPDFRRLSRP